MSPEALVLPADWVVVLDRGVPILLVTSEGITAEG
jgi:hypothetical protein